MTVVDPFVCPCCGADSAKLRLLAEWFELVYDGPSSGTEVQDDLRCWAEAIEVLPE